MAVELQGIEERHSAQIQQAEARFSDAHGQFRQQMTAMDARLETGNRQVADRLESLQTQHRTLIEQLEARLRAEREAENIPARIDSAVSGLRQSLEDKLAAEIHDLEARTPDRSPDLEKVLQYASLLEARVQALEQKVQLSAEQTVDRAVERVWQAIESRLQQREGHAAPAVVQPIETITGLRQKSTSAEQSVLDLIAGIGQLFEKPAPRAEREAAPRETPAAHVAPEPAVAAHLEPEPDEATHTAPEAAAETPAPAAPVETKVETKAEAPEPAPVAAVPPAQEEPAAAATAVEEPAEVMAEPKLEEKPPVILFRPRDSGRKWRIPFVSSFLLMAAAIAWLQFM